MHHKKRITFVFNRTGILVIVKLEIFFFFYIGLTATQSI